jgi:hypothetical protein
MGITVQFDTGATKRRIGKRLDRVQLALDIQVLKDDNLEIPQTNERTLQRSGRVVQGGGAVAWETPYAKRQYYLDEEVKNPAAIKYTTPGTHYKWHEWAKSKKMKQWEALANREYNRG